MERAVRKERREGGMKERAESEDKGGWGKTGERGGEVRERKKETRNMGRKLRGGEQQQRERREGGRQMELINKV